MSDGHNKEDSRIIYDAQSVDGFNEKILKLMCINQAIDKLQQEVNNLTGTRNTII